MLPLSGIRVLDFSTLLPGPLASLLLAEAGAEVIKVERPGSGDDMRGYEPQLDGTGAGFGLLNRGKRSLALNLKDTTAVDALLQLATTVDIVIEQFRPGVMDRLGLGWDAFRTANPRIIFCSITGYGQHGDNSQVAGHDLSYAADAGLLSLASAKDGTPVMPPTLIADIGGGSLPAVINILLALRRRDQTGEGCRLDISMADNLFLFSFWGLADGFGAGKWPRPGKELLTGGSPRYGIHRTADGRHVAAAPLEDKFWQVFCETIGLPAHLRDDAKDPAATLQAVAECVGSRPSSYWEQAFSRVDACCRVVRSLEEAAADPGFAARGLFDRRVSIGRRELPALPLPLDPKLRDPARSAPAPGVGADNQLMETPAAG